MNRLALPLLLIFFSTLQTQAQISLTDLNLAINALHAAYDAELKAKDEVLIVNPVSIPALNGMWWKSDDIRAAYSSLYDMDQRKTIHYLFVFGGYARLKGMTRDGVAATLCHELGHGIGGEPYKDYEEVKTPVSVEGQSDYFAFRFCLRRVFEYLPPTGPIKPVNAFTNSLCKSLPTDSYTFCTRAFQALESERTFFRLDPKDPNTTYDKPDLSIVTAVELDAYHYPSSQCRIDTMMNGILGKERPACWYVPPKGN